MICDHSMTVCNRYIQDGTEYYQLTYLSAVMWINRKAANVIRSGLLEADSVEVYIPKSRYSDYLSPKEWQAAESKTGYWTLQVGDFLVKGAVEDESGEPSIGDLKAAYDDVVQITSVDNRDFGSPGMQHWQVGAK